MKKFWDSYYFQMKETVRKKGFIISTLIMVGLILSLAYYNHQSENKEVDPDKVTIVYQDTAYRIDKEVFKKQFEGKYTVEETEKTLKQIKKEMKEGTISSAYTLSEKENLPIIEHYYNNQPNQTLSLWLEQHVKEQYIVKIAKEKNISNEDVQLLFAPIQTTYIQQTDLDRSYGLVYPLVFLMYLFIMGFGQSIAINVVSEKSSKVIEILLPKIHPIYSLYAKILSALSTGLLQFGILIFSFWITIKLGWSGGETLNIVGFDISLKDMNTESILWFLFFFVTGFLFYGLLYASIGAMVSKVEDLSPVLTPLVFLLMAAFGVGIYSIFEPTSTLSTISPYIPPFTPIVLFARILLEEASLVETIGSLSIFAITFVIITYFCQKWYKQGVSGRSFFKKKNKK